MRKAVIDMGSNSVRLLLAECCGNRIVSSEKHLEMTRLALGVDGTGLLQQGPMEETVAAVRRYKEMAEAFGADTPVAYATSAVRDARNGEQFAAGVYRETGVPVKIIPGELEAELGFLGVAATLEDPDEQILVVDIGGGSTECIVGSGRGIVFAESHNIGAVRMTGRYVTSDPIPDHERERMAKGISESLEPVCRSLGGYAYGRIYGIGGTLTTAAAMAMEMAIYDPQRIQHSELSRKGLQRLIDHVFSINLETRCTLAGLQPKRADVIPAGFQIMASLMDCLKADRFFASDADNLEGILFKYHLDGGQ